MAQAAEPKRGGRRGAPVIAVVVVGIALVAALVWWLVLRPSARRADDSFTGYVVSNNVYMASPVAGTLTEVAVLRGQRVKAGDPLFRVDPTVRAAQTEQARAQISANRALLAQQEAALATARSQLSAAQAEADRLQVQAERLAAAQRDKPGAVAQLDIDQARASFRAAAGRRDAARSELASAGAAIEAARAQVRQAEAGLTSAERQLADLARVAPGAGRIEEVMFKPGESLSADAPVVSIVPDGEVKVRFYVPQPVVNAFRPGRRVAIACDGCQPGMTAVVDFVATRPEYTPPIIYSLDARQKLVFLVEARPSNPQALIPGQPMDVAGRSEDLPRR